MRKQFGAKPWTYPQPVFILASYGEDGTPDAMNAAWGGISDSNQLTMCIGARHKTTANILARKAFTVSMATVSQMASCDYVGIASGNDVPNKLEKAAHGNIDPDKLQPIIFDPVHNDYREMGKKIGNAFQDGAVLK